MSVLATDNFNRAGPGLGANWTTVTGMGAPQIESSTTVRTNAVGTDSAARYSAITWPDDQYSQIKVVTTASTQRGVGVIVRCATGAATFYGVYAKNLGATATVTLFESTAGTGVDLATTTTTFSANDVLKLEAIGTALKVYRNGTIISALSVTDASITSGQAGILVFVDSGATTAAIGDDWEGGDIDVAGGQPIVKRMGGVKDVAHGGYRHGSGRMIWMKRNSGLIVPKAA